MVKEREEEAKNRSIFQKAAQVCEWICACLDIYEYDAARICI